MAPRGGKGKGRPKVKKLTAAEKKRMSQGTGSPASGKRVLKNGIWRWVK